ncbi:MAG: Zn-ribbon domain-containing OB-fold protein [Thermoplasmata archaeon]
MTIPRFWREFEQRYRLVGTKCPSCGRVYFPPRDVCPYCHRDSVGKMRKHELKPTGKIYSYTLVRQDIPDFKSIKPYIMVLVEMDDGPKITGQLTDIEYDEVKIGMPVKAVFRRIREESDSGIIEYGYKFVPL